MKRVSVALLALVAACAVSPQPAPHPNGRDEATAAICPMARNLVPDTALDEPRAFPRDDLGPPGQPQVHGLPGLEPKAPENRRQPQEPRVGVGVVRGAFPRGPRAKEVWERAWRTRRTPERDWRRRPRGALFFGRPLKGLVLCCSHPMSATQRPSKSGKVVILWQWQKCRSWLRDDRLRTRAQARGTP